MKPAPSIIAFTASSGLGYGLLIVIALASLLELVPSNRWLGLTGLAAALAFITAGLISSTFHLGRPERAVLALFQWRSSWLSREGLAAFLTYIPALIFGFGWVILEDRDGWFALMAALAVFGALITVYCTGMIYASLPPVRAWNHGLTAPIYLGFALMSGALATHCLLVVFGEPALWAGVLAMLATIASFWLKFLCWRRLGKMQPISTIQTATGLTTFSKVETLDPPHTQTNYLLHEFGFAIGRKHARRIRMLAIIFGLFGPLTLTLVALVMQGWTKALLAALALLSGMVGILFERWLFFAEAEHTSMLYYGGAKAEETPTKAPRQRMLAAPTPSAPTKPIKRQRRPVTVSMSGEILR